jgi:hypothetical protein
MKNAWRSFGCGSALIARLTVVAYTTDGPVDRNANAASLGRPLSGGAVWGARIQGLWR